MLAALHVLSMFHVAVRMKDAVKLLQLHAQHHPRHAAAITEVTEPAEYVQVSNNDTTIGMKHHGMKDLCSFADFHYLLYLPINVE